MKDGLSLLCDIAFTMNAPMIISTSNSLLSAGLRLMGSVTLQIPWRRVCVCRSHSDLEQGHSTEKGDQGHAQVPLQLREEQHPTLKSTVFPVSSHFRFPLLKLQFLDYLLLNPKKQILQV